ncbi:hypothetical protein QQ045_023933 [Rhodiola kirilowii]
MVNSNSETSSHWQLSSKLFIAIRLHTFSDLRSFHYQRMSYWSHRPIDDEDVDDFDEFDPTPYGGGYDIHLTYGRLIEPSEETCYQISSGGDDTVDYDRPNYSSQSEPSAYADEVLDNEYSSYSRPKHGRGRPPAASGGPGPAYGFQPGMNRPGYGEEEFGSGYGRKPEYEEPPPPPFRSEYEERPPPVAEFEGRRPGYGGGEEEEPPRRHGYGGGEEEEPPRRFGRPAYGEGEEEEPPRRFGRPEYGGGEEEEPSRRFGRPEYGGGEEEEPPRRFGRPPAEEEEPPRRFGRPPYGEAEEEERPRYGRRSDDDDDERPKYESEDVERPRYGRRNDEGEEEERPKYGGEEGYGRKKYGDEDSDEDEEKRHHNKHHHHRKSYDDE